MSSIERRAFLRYKMSIPVCLEASDGAVFDTVTRDISLGGMQVECDTTTLNRMLPQGIKTAPGDQVYFQAKLQFRDAAESVTIKTHVLGVLRLAESEFSIRFSFNEMDPVQQDQLQRLLNQ